MTIKGIITPGLLAFLCAFAGITVQWGIVHAKLEHMEKRLDEFLFESRSLNQNVRDIDRRVGTLEGRSR
ncbi:MAG: hypothetical protein AB7F75_01270 [Planctomycetota bacterium]